MSLVFELESDKIEVLVVLVPVNGDDVVVFFEYFDVDFGHSRVFVYLFQSRLYFLSIVLILAGERKGNIRNINIQEFKISQRYIQLFCRCSY